jgi:hypothetical protein
MRRTKGFLGVAARLTARQVRSALWRVGTRQLQHPTAGALIRSRKHGEKHVEDDICGCFRIECRGDFKSGLVAGLRNTHLRIKLRSPREGDTSDGPHRRKVRRPISLRVSCQERVFRRRPHHRSKKASCRVLDLRRRSQPLRFSRVHGGIVVLLTAIAAFVTEKATAQVSAAPRSPQGIPPDRR